jgi:large subunit ribosomal protein L13
MKRQKTYSPRPDDLQRDWYVVDAADLPLGRLASEIAKLIRGKHKPTYSPHMDGGDFVIVLNAAKVAVTGNKEEAKMYYRHSGYPGGLRAENLQQLRERQPERIIETAVRGMLPKNRLGRRLITKLKVYPGAEHPHASQQPKALELDVRKVRS